MQELIALLVAHLRGMWHRRWIGLGVAWLAAIVGVAVAMRVPEQYEATARLYVDTQSLLRPLMAGISIQPNLDTQVSLISRTLISRPNIEKLVRMTDMDLDTRGGEDLVDSVSRRILLSGNPVSNIYLISYRDPSPDRARKVVDGLVTIFVESSLGDKREDTVNAVKFIDDQIKRYEGGLKSAEDRLKSFRLKYLGVSGNANTNYYTKITTLSDQIEVARSQLRAAEEARDSYKRELAGEAPVLIPDTPLSGPAPASPVAIPAIDARLAVLRTDLDLLRRRFTDDHPDVVGTRRIIAQLEEQRKQEEDAINKASAAVNATASTPEANARRNPVFQQIKVALATAEANVASLRATLGSLEAQSARLISSAKLVPEVEAEYAQLNRDYDIQKRTYEALLARRESAALGEGVTDAGGTRFKVIDPPRVFPKAVFPNRFVMLSLAFGIALLAGLAAAFAANEIMPTFHDARSLGRAAKRPVVGMVTMFPNPAVRRRQRIFGALFASAASMFVVTYFGLLAFIFVTQPLV